MNKQICILIFLLTCRICNAQNLVPNGGFEQYSDCPISYNDFDSCLYYWFNPTIGGYYGSPDYFNICSPNLDLQVPDNYYGSQPTHSGVAYSGICLYYESTANYREYIEVQLTNVLSANTSYHFEMYVNVANICEFTTDAIQAYFSDTAVTGIPNFYPLPFIPQINNTIANNFDTLNWTLVSGNYIAHGGENFLLIGNFNDDANTNTVQNQTNTYDYAYVYIDDVSLTQTTGIDEEDKNNVISVFPNPVINELNVTMKNNELSEIILYDTASRKLLQKKFTNSISLDTEQLAKGIYLYEVRNKNGVIKRGKVVKD